MASTKRTNVVQDPKKKAVLDRQITQFEDQLEQKYKQYENQNGTSYPDAKFDYRGDTQPDVNEEVSEKTPNYENWEELEQFFTTEDLLIYTTIREKVTQDSLYTEKAQAYKDKLKKGNSLNFNF
jgi:hypothetical protein